MSLPDAKLYTKFIQAKAEYRVHVVADKVIAVHRKVQDGPGTDEVKNTANGWKFKKVTVFNTDIPTQALAAVKAVGLDFAAVDVLWDGQKAYVLEANTAPGIHEMTWTCQQYVEAFKKLTLV